jgi:hypothetical protein
MSTGKTTSRNKLFDPASGPATIGARVSGTGFAISAFLDFELEDVDKFPASKLLDPEGISVVLSTHGTHVLEFVIAFKSKTASSCEIDCTLKAEDGAEQRRTTTVSGKVQDIARISFHAPVE